MKGGIRGAIRRTWQDEQLLWQLLLAGAFAGSVVGTILVLSGLADVTNFCLNNQPLGVGAGIKLQPPLTALSTEVMRIERAKVTNPNGTFNCGRFFRFDWTLWALQFVFMCIFGFIWYKRAIRRFMPGLVAIGTAVTAWHMYKCNYTLDMEPWTYGELHTGGWVIGVGLVACMIGNFCMLLFAGPYSERERDAARVAAGKSAGTMASSDANMKGLGGTQSSFDTESPRPTTVVASQV
ncbi:hypothetical protein [Rhizobium sp. AAP43]|uniref:hypothetical protein n=1 Tax=Rhizobium sp. AAP43 TaxID=1523420 RepID=UPI0006B9EDC5|nr:hypothetical protein [Rhizobium sp. AAP43]KPF41709.1 hypothetical protein IP76_20195 [Rhizobium sp. AAP43]